MVRPKEIWVAWAISNLNSSIELIGSVPQDTDEDDLDAPEYTESTYERYVPNGPYESLPKWRLYTGTLECYLGEFLSAKLSKIKITKC